MRRFQGIVPPLVTPLLSPDVLDVAGLERLVDHVLAGDHARVATEVARARKLAQLYEVGRMPGRIVVGIKAALAARGLCGPVVASPFEQFDEEQSHRVREILDRLEEPGPQPA